MKKVSWPYEELAFRRQVALVVEALKVEEVGEMKTQRPGLLDDVLDVMYERKSGSGFGLSWVNVGDIN